MKTQDISTIEETKVSSLNAQQELALNALINFTSSDTNNEAFILSGSAGTGKTTLLKEYTRFLESIDFNYQLLTPTGRAAKVLSRKTERAARTLHSFLYRVIEKEHGGITKMEFIPRKLTPTIKTIIIIDESSMISNLPEDNDLFHSTNSILYELIALFKSCPLGSKLVFVGDIYQLPPINENVSLSLDGERLRNTYQISSISFELTEIVRQENGSYILTNATLLRNLMKQKKDSIPMLKYKNMYRIDLAVNNYCNLFDQNDSSKTIFIGWKNATIDKLNKVIRNQIHNNPGVILTNEEQIILCRTIYKQAYISSGEIGKVILFDPESIETIADTRFAESTLQFTTPNGEIIEFKTKVDIDFLLSDPDAESPERAKKLWANRKKNNKIFRESNNINDDPYLSALKIKYGYAITAHKAQGGEWDHVFLYPEFPKDENRLKWVYTSITRAKNELYSFQNS